MNQSPNEVNTHDRWMPIFNHFAIPSGKWFNVCRENSPTVLVLCQGGNVRSAAAAFLLRYKYGIDAVSASLECNSPDTLDLLYAWANYVLIMDERLMQYVPEEWEKHRVRLCAVGPDHFGDPFRMDLLQKVFDTLPIAFAGTNVLSCPRVSDGTYGNPHITAREK